MGGFQATSGIDAQGLFIDYSGLRWRPAVAKPDRGSLGIELNEVVRVRGVACLVTAIRASGGFPPFRGEKVEIEVVPLVE